MAAFIISNDGYINLVDIDTACYMREMQVSGSTFRNSFYSGYNPRELELKPDESFTVGCGAVMQNVPLQEIKQIDLGVVMSYRPWLWPFSYIKRVKVFRFIGRPGSSTIKWFKQPSSIIDEDASRKMKLLWQLQSQGK